MRILVLYPYPRRTDGQSLQGHYLAKGLKENGVEVMSCDRFDDNEKQLIYEHFKPDFIVGIGMWKDIPPLVLHPLKYGMKPIPWFNANGWVANYQPILNDLPILLTTSNWVKETYIRDGVDGKNIKVSPIGFDPRTFFPDAEIGEKKRKELGIAEDEIMILTAGGDVTSKGAQEILKALAKVGNKFTNWKYVLKTLNTFSAMNHGKEEEKLIEELNLPKEKIIYVRDDYSPNEMATLLNACDIYAAPSRLEGFGMIQLEAQACGKPVVSINVGGPAETVFHNITGFLADVSEEIKLSKEWADHSMGFDERKQVEFSHPKTFAYRADVKQLSDYLLKLMSDKNLRDKMGKSAAEHALKNFNYKETARKMIELIEEKFNAS
jgi:alpha-maltose-1-phosphate synthase